MVFGCVFIKHNQTQLNFKIVMHDDELYFIKFLLFTFLMLHRYTEVSPVTVTSTRFRRRPVGHETTELGRLFPQADGEGANCVAVTL